MPEGHTIHRAARLQSRRFSGVPLAVWSPQGRFDEGAAVLDGRRIAEITAYGKHLFYRWDHGPVLHVHLGLFGRFSTHVADPPEPSAGTRLAMSHPGATLYLSGPTVCDVIDEDRVRSIVERLGPDPLARRSNGAARTVHRSLARRSVPIGAALLDQRVVAGIGNVYRAELLFLAGIDPRRRASAVEAAEVEHLWRLAGQQLRRGERSGRIVTVTPVEAGVGRDRDVPREDRLYAYKRAGLPCRRCGTPIISEEMGGRAVWWCPTCQPR